MLSVKDKIIADEMDLHWLAVAALFEDLRCHVSWRSAGCGQDVELLLVHDPRQSEVGNQ